MNTYEAVFILNEREIEDSGEKLGQQIEDHLVSLGGRILKRVNMGRTSFARPIKKQTSGIYLDFIFMMEPDQVRQISAHYKLNTAVTRVGVLLYEGPPVAEEN